MCDCYNHPCEFPNCDQTVPMHIEDFSEERNRFKCWCPTHAKKADAAATIFLLEKSGIPYAILGPKAGTPNTPEDWKTLTVKDFKQRYKHEHKRLY